VSEQVFNCPFDQSVMTCEILVDQRSILIFEAQDKVQDRQGKIQGHLPRVFLNKKRVCPQCHFVALFGK